MQSVREWSGLLDSRRLERWTGCRMDTIMRAPVRVRQLSEVSVSRAESSVTATLVCVPQSFGSFVPAQGEDPRGGKRSDVVWLFQCAGGPAWDIGCIT